ncbi:hypothetical protein Cgig2_017040 [Carnegiea gigantea]|uniref:CW-type domain-containing protein n=1 Tax=Carnegiea gigantea TaxID=171969 RepID=A0A9Q1KHY7_9CARY|nr:hypothetical protein Cgig2_017040 [Carnegiea gigantea]
MVVLRDLLHGLMKMKDIELEEGEAYFLQDDDDENIDPDRDFSYIDKKIENVLGHYQKDFMGGPSAENLGEFAHHKIKVFSDVYSSEYSMTLAGARLGDYGSFLPMQQRFPPILSNPTAQSHVSSKSPQNPSSDRLHQNPSAVANHSLPVRAGLSSNDQSMQAPSESGLSLTNKQSKLQRPGEGSFNDQQKKPLIHHADQSSLKFRVKMTSENVSRDNSALYSGLGLDMSPSSSPDDSPGQYDRTSRGMQESTEESPSCIVKIMTSPPLFNDVLLSPLNDSLISFMQMENNSGSGKPGSTEDLPVNSIHGSIYSEAKREIKEGRKSKFDDTSKDKKSKQKESRKDGKLKQKVHSMKAREPLKENQEYPANTVALPANKNEVSEISIAKAAISKISNNAIGDTTKTGDATGSKPSIQLGKKNEIGHLEEVGDKSMKQERGAKARDKSTGEFAPVPSHDVGMGGEGNVNSSRGKTEKEKNVISNPKKDSSERRNEVGRREVETNKSLKQQIVAKEKAKEVVLNALFPKEDDVHRKENVTSEKIPKFAVVGFVSMKDVEGNDKHFDVSQDGENRNVETIEPLKKSHSKAMSNPQMVAGVPIAQQHLPAIAKKKSKESHTDGVSVPEPPSNVPSKSKKGDMDLHKETRKDTDSATNVSPGRKIKEVNPKDPVMGISQREMHAVYRKMEGKSMSRKMGIASDVGSNIAGDLAGGTTGMEKAPAVGVLPTENALSIPMDDWVMCEKCKKWRLLPFGRNPDLLPKKWICKMLDWLPGMNKCSVTEEETTNALYSMYQIQVPASLVQNNQQAYPDGSAALGASVGAQSVGLPTRAAVADAASGGGNTRNLVKTEINAARQGRFPGLDVLAKREQQFGEHRNSKNLKKHPQEAEAIAKNGDGKPSKIAKKRVADFEASGAPKKMKRQSMGKPDPVGMLPVKTTVEGLNYNPDALQFSEDFAKGIPESPLMKAKDRTQKAMVAGVDEKKDVSGKKRKKDQWKSVVPTEQLSARAAVKKGATEHRKEKKEKKSKMSNFQPREHSIDKVDGGNDSVAGKHNLATADDNDLLNGSRMNDITFDKHHVERAFQRTVDSRKSSQKAHDLGLDNATTSSSSKISYKVKVKGCEVKSSPVGSISSSPMKVSKSDLDKNVNKTSVSHEETEELSPAKRLKSRVEGSSDEFAAHSEEMKVRKSNLSRTSGVMVDASEDDRSAKRTSSGKRPGAHGVDTHPKLEGHACGKVDISHEEGTSTSLQKFVSENRGARSVNRLHFHETKSQRGKSDVFDAIIKKEPSCHSHSLPKFEEGSMPNAMRVDQVSLRHPDPTGPVSRDIGASSSIADGFYKAAKTALKEATDLKHSANHLKKSGSGLESTRVFFQAALKFLHGASLLEPDHSESGTCGEMSPSDVYSTTAKLCEYCAREYERFNDMASAALAYKCMEIAYMRVVYYNDLAASRDRMALHMAVRAAPQGKETTWLELLRWVYLANVRHFLSLAAESPSSSASDIDNLNNQAATDTEKNGNSSIEHRNHVISAGNRPNFMRLLDFTKDINLAMEASRRSQSAFTAAKPVLVQAGNEERLSCIKRVLDFSFHDVDGLLHLVRLAMDALNN